MSGLTIERRRVRSGSRGRRWQRRQEGRGEVAAARALDVAIPDGGAGGDGEREDHIGTAGIGEAGQLRIDAAVGEVLAQSLREDGER